MTKRPYSSQKILLPHYLAIGVFLSTFLIILMHRRFLSGDNQFMDRATMPSEEIKWQIANTTREETEEQGTEREKDKGRQWIISTVHQNTARDCAKLFDVSSAVVRISLHEFMNNENSPGRPFLPLFQYIKSHYDPNNIVPGIPGVTPSIKLEAARLGNIRGLGQCHAYALHNFKVGGTALLMQQARLQKQNIRIPPFPNRRTEIVESKNHNSSLPYEIGVFSFVRDPVSRFVSAVRQVVQLDRCGDCRDCVKSSFGSKNTTQLISCLLDVMETKNSYLDRHLTPQTFTLYNALGGQDIHVDLMDLADLDSVLDGLLPDRNVSDATVNANTGTTRGFNVSGVAILPPELIRRVCRFYEVDLRLLRETSLLTETMCDDPRFRAKEPWIPTPGLTS
eukprot:scaffold1341_cov178-Amphora_coffeaeformis.AAC.22